MTHRPRKRFGQNFLLDASVIRRIVDSIHPIPGQHLLEIGPGQGALTKPLLEAIGRLEVVELDRDLVEPLARKCANLGRLRIYTADALKFDFCALVSGSERLRVVGNLPYNISTPLLFHLLEHARCIQDMHFMLQKEVVARMAAAAGNKTYGRLSVMLQAHAKIEHLFDVDAGAFAPRPKVDSSVVRLVPYAESPVFIEDRSVFRRVVTQAFSQRRKTLRNSLRGLVTAETMLALGIDSGLRAENLELSQFAKLANAACKNPAPT